MASRGMVFFVGARASAFAPHSRGFGGQVLVAHRPFKQCYCLEKKELLKSVTYRRTGTMKLALTILACAGTVFFLCICIPQKVVPPTIFLGLALLTSGAAMVLGIINVFRKGGFGTGIMREDLPVIFWTYMVFCWVVTFGLLVGGILCVCGLAFGDGW